MIETPTRPALRYFGGKWRIAPWIISQFPAHSVYVEPYGGAAGVLLRKPRSFGEVYNDLDGAVVNFFRVLRNPSQRARLIELVRYTPYARSEFKEAFKAADNPVERARRLLIRAEMGFGSAGATKGSTGFRCASLRHPNRKNPSRNAQNLWAELPENLERVAARFQGVMIENRPAEKVISYWDRQETLFYVDPPYLPSVRERFGRRSYYRHEMTEEQHCNLLKILQTLKGMVFLSGYYSKIYDSFLSGWHREDKKVAISGNKGSSIRTECLWQNPAAVNRFDKMKQRRLFNELLPTFRHNG